MSNVLKKSENTRNYFAHLSANKYTDAARHSFGKKPVIKPKITDIEAVAFRLTAEYMSIDSQNALFKQLKGFP